MNKKLAALTSLAVVSFAACNETAQPPLEEPDAASVRVTEPVDLAAIRVSDIQAIQNTAPTTPAGSPPSGMVTYVSVAPGTFDADGNVRIMNRSNGVEVSTVSTEGGFDPVAIAAAVGDEIDVELMVNNALAARIPVVVPPEVPPVIVRTDPPRRKRGIPLNSMMLAVFSEPLDIATVNEASVRLSSEAGPTAGIVALTSGGVGVLFIPSQPLQPNTDYTLTIDGSVTDMAGLPFGASASIDFQTGADAGQSVTLFPDTATVQVGETIQLTVQIGPTSVQLTQLADTSIVWSSNNPSVASVNQFGGVTGVSSGSAFIIAERFGQADSSLVTVTAGSGGSGFAVTPTTLTLGVGQSWFVAVSGADTSLGPVIWNSSDASIASVGAGGLVTGVAEGQATVTASHNAQTASVAVTVSSSPGLELNPDTLVLAEGASGLLVPFSGADSIAPTSLSWFAVDTTIATVNGTGLVSAWVEGQTWVIVSGGLGTDSSLVIVSGSSGGGGGGTPGFDLQPDTLQLQLNETGVLVPFRTNSSGFTTVDSTAVFWSRDSSLVGLNGGSATGLAVGQVYVGAVSGSDMDSTLVVVSDTPGNPIDISISPTSVSLTVGETQGFSWSTTDQRLILWVAEWLSTDSTVVAVDSTGVAIAVGPGQAGVIVRSGTVADTASVVVVN